MNKLLCTIQLSGSLLIAGLATAATHDGPANDVPAVPGQALTAAAGQAVIQVKRSSGVAGGACDVSIFVDGSPVATLARGEFTQFTVPAGEREVKARFALSDFCPVSVRSLKVTATEGSTTQLVYNVAHFDRTTFHEVR
ncbi:hypothetical protein [Roseateles sp. LYH14W]|uniref:PEGA domain-containing protein n=1 Tax=Pelomonas parva TaxID=3299032 RepID=A0ABW7FCK0_9BURK